MPCSPSCVEHLLEVDRRRPRAGDRADPLARALDAGAVAAGLQRARADQRQPAHVRRLGARVGGRNERARRVERGRELGVLGHADARMLRRHRGGSVSHHGCDVRRGGARVAFDALPGA